MTATRNAPDEDDHFARSMLTSFQYPFGGSGVFILISGGLMFTIADFLTAYAGIVGLLVQAAIIGYLAAYCKDVVRTSAMGENNPPGWADFSDWLEDMVVPAGQFLTVIAISFGFMVYLEFKHPLTGWRENLLWLAAGAWGCLVSPILFMAVAMTDTVLAALNPVPLARAVWLTLSSYLLVCLLGAALVGLGFGAAELSYFARHIPILPDLFGRLTVLYLFTVLMRSFGLLYRHNHELLVWY